MAAKIPNYVFPPHLDFMNDQDIEPFAMYIFEFSHRLSKQDLANIWQNVMPDIAVTAEKDHATVTHKAAENEFFRGNKIPDNTRWMVFKVKKRAASNYYKMTADSKDDHRFNYLNYISDDEMERYNYNWPYDFFSLVELAKIDTTINIGDESIPVPPRGMPIIGSTIVSAAQQLNVGNTPLVMKPKILNPALLGSTLPALNTQVDTAIQNSQTAVKQKAMINLGSNAGGSSLLNALKKLGGGTGNQ